MKLLIFSDIHGDMKSLERLMSTKADYYFCAGDLATFQKGLDKAGPILESVGGHNVHVMPGNHESEEDIAQFCKKYNLRFFHNRSVDIRGLYVAGLGYSNITPFNTPGEFTEAQFEARLGPWNKLKPLVLICHCPPLNTPLDRAGEGKHFGSPTIRKFIDDNQPDWFFCGHIHEAEGATTIMGRTRGVNAGKRGYLLEV